MPINVKLDAEDLDRRLSAFDPRVVLVYGYAQRLQRHALRWAKGHGKNALMFSDSELRQPRSLFRRVLKRLWLPWYYCHVDGFLTTGDANEEYYRHYGVSTKQLFRSPYPIDCLYYDTFYREREAHRTELRRRLGIAGDRFVCLMVGKLVSWKRQADLISMLRYPNLLARDTTVILVGKGEQEPRLRALAREVAPDRVIFAGFVQPSDLPPYYATADLYVQTSEREPHSVAVSEAIFMGCPVVISDRCGSYGPSDDVQTGRNGFVYPYGDIPALAWQVGRLAQDDSLRNRFGVASRAIGERSQQQAHGEGLQTALTALGVL